MKILLILAILIGSHSTYAQDVQDKPQVVERAPENDGATDRAPVDEGGGPGNGEEVRVVTLQMLADRATVEKPLQVSIETLKALKLRDGKSIKPADIVELSLNEEKRIETVELKNNQIIHRLDVDTAVVKPNPILTDIVTVTPDRVRFTITVNPKIDPVEKMKRALLGGAIINSNEDSNSDNNTNSALEDYFRSLNSSGNALRGTSLMRVMGVDGGGRIWIDEGEDSSSSDNTPFKIKIGVDGGGISQ